MNQWIVPKWNQSQQHEDASRSSHVHFPHKNTTCTHNLAPMAKDGHGEVLLQMASTKHSWGQSEDTLESIVHSSLLRKRTRSSPEGKDETFMSGAFLESHRSFKAKNSIEDLAPDDGSEDEHNTKRKTSGSCSIRRTQSERKRRDRINQKLKDLQKLVPNRSKTDRASLLDDTIQYLKQLKAQVQFMCSIRSDVPQMIIPLGMQQQQQQQLQVSLLAARMGLLDTASMAPSSSSFPCAAACPPTLLPSIISSAKPKSKLSTSAFVPPTDPFCTLLAQSMDMDLYSKMVTLYCQEVNRTPRQASKLMESQCVEGIEEDMHQS